MTDLERQLSELIARVPVHVVDVVAARQTGDLAALRYAKAIRAWLDEATGLMAQQVVDMLDEGGRVESREAGEHRPHGELPSELIPNSIFPPRAG
jgi:hypothetical protein